MNSTPANGYLIENDACTAQYRTVEAIKEAIANIKPGQRIEVQTYADVTEIVAEVAA
jgi:hypothetical protein